MVTINVFSLVYDLIGEIRLFYSDLTMSMTVSMQMISQCCQIGEGRWYCSLWSFYYSYYMATQALDKIQDW